MDIDYQINRSSLAKQIADAIRALIVEGGLVVDQRLPSETELAERFGVSRPTVREALKRLAAQNLIQPRRGPTGGSFVKRISWSEAHDALVTTATMLVSMNDIDFETVAEARFSLEQACLEPAARRREESHLATMREEISRQQQSGLSDEEFCASDVRFHRTLVEATGNAVLSFQMAGVIEAMQPLMNMLTYRKRDRARIAALHQRIVEALQRRAASSAGKALRELHAYTVELAAAAQAERRGVSAPSA